MVGGMAAKVPLPAPPLVGVLEVLPVLAMLRDYATIVRVAWARNL